MNSFARPTRLIPIAYVVLAAAFLMQTAFAGSHFTFGVFLKPLARDFQWGRGETAFAYTLQWWISSPAAVWLGWLSDRIGARKVLLFGGLIFGLGFLLSSTIHSLWQFYLYFGVFAGVGRAAARAPLLSAVFQFFNKRKGLAVGITLSGTGVGTFLFPSLARYVMSVANWSAAFLVIGALSTVMIVTSALFIRAPKPGEVDDGKISAGSKGQGIDAGGLLGSPGQVWTVRKVLHHRVFILFLVMGLFCCISHSLPLAHIVAYATDRGIGDMVAASVLGLLGVSAAVGRLLWGAVSDRIGARKAVLCCIALQTAMMFWVAFAQGVWLFRLFAITFGLAYGGVLPLYAVVTRELFGMRRFGTIYGMHSFATSLGMGAGGLVGGILFDYTGSYFIPFMTSTALGIIATALAIHLAFLKGPGAPIEFKTVEVEGGLQARA
jgi:MFS family permease